MSETYSKLSSGIVYSRLWAKDGDTCKLFVTFLAMKDQDGIVRVPVAALAHLARIGLEKCREAIAYFESPDPDSSCRDQEGRMILALPDGGWKVVAHEKYYQYGWSDTKKEIERQRKASYRERQKEQGAPAIPANNPKTNGVTPRAVSDEWNKTPGLPQCLSLSDKRRRGLVNRLTDPFFAANWKPALARVASSKFCRGESERGWKATFDWFIQPDSVAKIMEGKYDDRTASAKPDKPNPRNFGIVKGPTDYATAIPKKQRELEARKAAMGE